jgi:hypothetical protein
VLPKATSSVSKGNFGPCVPLKETAKRTPKTWNETMPLSTTDVRLTQGGSSNVTRIFLALVMTTLLALAALTAIPEQSAVLLTPSAGWTIKSPQQRSLKPSEVPPQLSWMRRSAANHPDSVLYRNWSPENGVQALNVISPPFKPSQFMSVLITGGTRSPAGGARVFLKCAGNGNEIDVFSGSVNSNISEALVYVSQDWCSEDARLNIVSTDPANFVGAGSVFSISMLSYLKSSSLGKFAYLIVSLGIYALVMYLAVLYAQRVAPALPAVPVAFVGLGIVSLAVFYLTSGYAMTNRNIRWSPLITIVITILFSMVIPIQKRKFHQSAQQELKPYFLVWVCLAIGYFALSGLGVNGLGHWEPNYRFWPATWSSDNELPWVFAEALKNRWNLSELFGGSWKPTDRPPLMTGAHLLATDFFSLMQATADGTYLRGQGYNAAAIALSALWAPAVMWVIKSLCPQMSQRNVLLIIFTVAIVPFVIFNTIFGWPKVYGAAIALCAFSVGWSVMKDKDRNGNTERLLLFFTLCALSMLAHASAALFLGPLVLYFLLKTRLTLIRMSMPGLAAAVTLMASWSTFKYLALKSSDPITCQVPPVYKHV